MSYLSFKFDNALVRQMFKKRIEVMVSHLVESQPMTQELYDDLFVLMRALRDLAVDEEVTSCQEE